MISSFKSLLYLTLVVGLIIQGCGEKAKYERMVERELEKGIRKDSLFLGISLGMSKKDFYAHCWGLNKKGLLHNGAKNTTVLYELKDLKYPANMNFYPGFYKDKISTMPVLINYVAWAPWNKKLFADSLQLDVVNLFEKWYGDGFMAIKDSEDPDRVAYLKVDGNRQIAIYKSSDSEVAVMFTDLLVEKELKAKNKNVKSSF